MSEKKQNLKISPKELIKKITEIFKKHKKVVLSSAVALVCIIILIDALLTAPGKTTISAESSLKEILNASEVSTVEYPYNSIIKVSNETETKYYTSYEGKVRAGYNLKDVVITKDEKQKIIKVQLPKIKITSVSVDDKSLDFIFTRNKYHTETVFQEAYGKCVEDLKQKAESNTDLKQVAYENAKSSMDALIKPLNEQNIEGYQIVCE